MEEDLSLSHDQKCSEYVIGQSSTRVWYVTGRILSIHTERWDCGTLLSTKKLYPFLITIVFKRNLIDQNGLKQLAHWWDVKNTSITGFSSFLSLIVTKHDDKGATSWFEQRKHERTHMWLALALKGLELKRPASVLSLHHTKAYDGVYVLCIQTYSKKLEIVLSSTRRKVCLKKMQATKTKSML